MQHSCNARHRHQNETPQSILHYSWCYCDYKNTMVSSLGRRHSSDSRHPSTPQYHNHTKNKQKLCQVSIKSFRVLNPDSIPPPSSTVCLSMCESSSTRLHHTHTKTQEEATKSYCKNYSNSLDEGHKKEKL